MTGAFETETTQQGNGYRAAIDNGYNFIAFATATFTNDVTVTGRPTNSDIKEI